MIKSRWVEKVALRSCGLSHSTFLFPFHWILSGSIMNGEPLHCFCHLVWISNWVWTQPCFQLAVNGLSWSPQRNETVCWSWPCYFVKFLSFLPIYDTPALYCARFLWSLHPIRSLYCLDKKQNTLQKDYSWRSLDTVKQLGTCVRSTILYRPSLFPTVAIFQTQMISCPYWKYWIQHFFGQDIIPCKK